MEGIEEMGTVQKRKRKLIPEIKTGRGGRGNRPQKIFFGGGGSLFVCFLFRALSLAYGGP